MQKMRMVVIGLCILLVVVSCGCTSNQTTTVSDNEDDNYVEDVKDTTAPKEIDTDGDGYNDTIDAFPHDPNEWIDSDNDGVGDNSDAFPNDPTEWLDSDRDKHGDNSDDFPNDSNYSKIKVLFHTDYQVVDSMQGPFYREAVTAVPITSDIKYVAWEIEELSNSTFDLEISKVGDVGNYIYDANDVTFSNEKIYVNDGNIGKWSWNWFPWPNEKCTISINIFYVI